MSPALHTRFRHLQSSTFRPTNRTFSITYGCGTVKGIVVHDTVRVTVQHMLSQDWLWSDYCLQNRCRTIWQDPSKPNSHRYWPSYPQDHVSGETGPMVNMSKQISYLRVWLEVCTCSSSAHEQFKVHFLGVRRGGKSTHFYIHRLFQALSGDNWFNPATTPHRIYSD